MTPATLRTRAARSLAILLALPLLVTSARAAEGYRELGVDDVEKMLGARDVLILDVNPPELFARGHLPGAVLVTRQTLRERLPRDKSTRLVFYCASKL